ncbi:MAG: hypothetical protein JWO85_3246 [Candidatus Eremiobacteraeota bacterium]|nr:hypothetical protein [Candidatus Eremiobacteraeota bacterium]
MLLFSLLAAGASAAAPRSEGFVRLTVLEDRAERIAGGAETGAAARAAAAQVVSGWPAVRSDFAAERAARWSLSAVDGEVAALRTASDEATLERAANETTGALAPLFELAGDTVPVSVRLFDYLERSIALDARDGDWARAAADGATLERTWVTLRPIVLQHHGQTAAAAADRSVAVIETALHARNAARVVAGARDSGLAASLLEKVFHD